MGCTSSAPNMTPSIANSDQYQNSASEMEEQTMEEENEMAHEKVIKSNGIKALPCDTVDEPDLDSDNKSNYDTNQDHTEDSHGNEHLKSEIENNSSNDLETNNEEEKLSHLEEVVEKVVELYENGELDIKRNEIEEKNDGETEIQTDERTENTVVVQKPEETINDEEEETQAPASPSQSQSSRATRWEALADIAAELPPSLAVDPITGQIYTHSK